MIPEGFSEILKEELGADMAGTAIDALEAQPSVSIRLNPSKLAECPFPSAVPVPWSPFGYILEERPSFTLDPLFHAGCYYVQDSSAMFAGHVFRRILPMLEPGAAVLDLCAAPGGKSTDLAASLRERFGDNFTLLANEVMHSRFGTLRANLETWGDVRCGCVSRDPSAFGDTPLFDVILADVPCSGEGMFRKDPRAVQEWSPETVEFCAARSRRILADIWPALKPGGYLIYSTCTFNRRENDGTAEWIASELGAEILPPEDFPPTVTTKHGNLLLPGLVPGEGQYVSLLRKAGNLDSMRRADIFRLFKAALPEAGDKGLPMVDTDLETALKYLHGDAVVLPEGAPIGPVVISYKGHALGQGKNLGKRCNNLYPKAKRIRMDIR